VKEVSNTLRVLHFNRFSHSGQTTHVFALVDEQQRQGLSASLIMESYPAYQALEMYRQTIARLGAVIISPSNQAALSRENTDNQWQLIHAHSSLTFPTAAALAQKLQIPLVVTCHGLGLNQQEQRPYLQKASAVICISQRVAYSLREFADKIRVVPNGVDLQEYMPGEKGEPLKIALVSRVDGAKTKGFLQFCKAVDLLEDVEFYVAGNKKPPGNKARYLGWTNEIAPLLVRTDILAGTGRACLEGLAAGNAVLVLGRNYQGILTPEKARQKHPDLSGLAGSEPCYRTIFFDLASLMQNRAALRSLQTFGRELAEREFDNRLLTKKITGIYRQVLERI
jgi:glycosyltransferase involved in cell wall biosynthesis